MKKNVEDILAQEKITHQQIRDEARDQDEALQIFSFLKTPKHRWSVSDKTHLKSRIHNSIDSTSRRRVWRIWLAAASFLLLTSIGGMWYFQVTQTSNIADFAQTVHESRTDTVTRLVLGQNQQIEIPEIESKIAYCKQGEEIVIGESQTVQQELETVDPIYNTIIVPYGKRSKITLSEGTKVWLNSGTKMVYPALFASNQREVYIDGEAIFEVSKDPARPFIVKSHQFDIEVIGTIFNIHAYSEDESSSAVLKQGIIKISHQSKPYLPAEKKQLSPGVMATFDPQKESFELKRVNPTDYLSWHSGYYIFKRESLSNILKRLSRYYNVEIDLKDRQLAQVTFSGSLDFKTKPEEVLNIIKRTTPISFRKEGQKIIIY